MRPIAVMLLMLTMAGPSRAGLVELIARSKPAVVAIGTYSELDNPRFGFRGSGFAVGDGQTVVTNMHVLPDPDAANLQVRWRLVVQVPRGSGSPEMRTATVTAQDPAHDLALLRIDGPPLPVLGIARPDDVREGLSIAVIGFPIGAALGFNPVTHQGMISSIMTVAPPMPASRQLNERAIRQVRAGSFDVYQLDATAYPGNSGGPVLDVESGKVVGVINKVFVQGSRESALSQPTGISYAVPARYVADLLKTDSPR